jgi:hypothetical protein
VQTLADQWGYVRDETGTTVWFWLSGTTMGMLGPSAGA